MNHFGTEPVEKQCHIATTVSIMNTGRLADGTRERMHKALKVK